MENCVIYIFCNCHGANRKDKQHWEKSSINQNNRLKTVFFSKREKVKAVDYKKEKINYLE